MFNVVASPVNSLTSNMSSKEAVITWNKPSYIPANNSMVTYEIGYNALQSNNCIINTTNISVQLMFQSSVLFIVSSTNYTVNNLFPNTCYLFGVRPFTNNNYGLWKTIVDRTTPQQSGIYNNICMYMSLKILVILIGPNTGGSSNIGGIVGGVMTLIVSLVLVIIGVIIVALMLK